MRRLMVILGLSALLLFLIARTPASLLWHWSGSAFPELHLVDVHGSLWKGQAAAAYFRGMSLGPVRWRWQPLALALGRWSNRVEAGSPAAGIEADVARSLTGALIADDMKVRMPLEALMGRYLFPGKRLPVAVGGLLEAEIDELVYRDGAVDDLHGRLHATALSVDGVLYGDALAGIEAFDGGITVDLGMAPNAPVQLEGRLSLTPDGDYALSLTVEDPGALGRQADALIRSLAKPSADRHWRLEWQGRL